MSQQRTGQRLRGTGELLCSVQGLWYCRRVPPCRRSGSPVQLQVLPDLRDDRLPRRRRRRRVRGRRRGPVCRPRLPGASSLHRRMPQAPKGPVAAGHENVRQRSHLIADLSARHGQVQRAGRSPRPSGAFRQTAGSAPRGARSSYHWRTTVMHSEASAMATVRKGNKGVLFVVDVQAGVMNEARESPRIISTRYRAPSSGLAPRAFRRPGCCTRTRTCLAAHGGRHWRRRIRSPRRIRGMTNENQQ